MRYFDPVNIGKRVSKSCALTQEFRLMPGLAEKREACDSLI